MSYIVKVEGESTVRIYNMHNMCYTTLQGKYCDVWWFPGTNNPQEPCYGYWNIRDKQNTPWQFFGLSSVGPTILEYDTFTPGIIPPGAIDNII